MRDIICYCLISLFNPAKTQIEKIKRYGTFFDKCFVIDDSEHKLLQLEDYFDDDKIEYIWNERNEGLSKTINKGLIMAIEQNVDWIVIMDQDSMFDNSILNVYMKFLEKNSNDEGIKTIAALTPQYNYDRHKRTAGVGYKNMLVSELSGSMVSINAIKKIGLYDERFFADGLDLEWCLRARRKGYRIVRCNEAVLNHHPGETRELRLFGKRVFQYGWHTPERYYYQFRSFLLLHHLYHNFYCDILFIYKFTKVLVLFENKEAYMKAWKIAKEDYKAEYFGKKSI